MFRYSLQKTSSDHDTLPILLSRQEAARVFLRSQRCPNDLSILSANLVWTADMSPWRPGWAAFFAQKNPKVGWFTTKKCQIIVSSPQNYQFSVGIVWFSWKKRREGSPHLSLDSPHPQSCPVLSCLDFRLRSPVAIWNMAGLKLHRLHRLPSGKLTHVENHHLEVWYINYFYGRCLIALYSFVTNDQRVFLTFLVMLPIAMAILMAPRNKWFMMIFPAINLHW